MKKIIISILFCAVYGVFFNFSIAAESFDLDKESLQIPDTHESKQFIWEVRKNPRGFVVSIEQSKPLESPIINFRVIISPPENEKIESAQFFMVDKDFRHYEHIFPTQQTGNVSLFNFQPASENQYRIETVLKTDKGWVKIDRDLKFADIKPALEKSENLKNYQINIKTFPQKVYADHTVTFVFEIFYNGEPVTGLEKIKESEIHLASWGTSFFNSFGEFIYATSSQNLGGPEAGVSMVFERPGTHKIFATFRHLGKNHTIETEIEAMEEEVSKY